MRELGGDGWGDQEADPLGFTELLVVGCWSTLFGRCSAALREDQIDRSTLGVPWVRCWQEPLGSPARQRLSLVSRSMVVDGGLLDGQRGDVPLDIGIEAGDVVGAGVDAFKVGVGEDLSVEEVG